MTRCNMKTVMPDGYSVNHKDLSFDPIARLDFVGDVELKLGVAFRDEDVEFLETPSDLIERGAEILIRGGAR